MRGWMGAREGWLGKKQVERLGDSFGERWGESLGERWDKRLGEKFDERQGVTVRLGQLFGER